MGPKRTDPIPRFWAKVNKTESCWLWTAAKDDQGYGIFDAGTKKDPDWSSAHRFAMRLAGIKLENVEGHHVCPNKNCVRVHPEHVRPVPRFQNPDSPPYMNRLKTHCVNGHPLAGENVFIRQGGKRRRCRTCANLKNKAWRKRNPGYQRPA